MNYMERLRDEFAIAIAAGIRWGELRNNTEDLKGSARVIYNMAEAFVEEKRRRSEDDLHEMYEIPAHAMATMKLDQAIQLSEAKDREEYERLKKQFEG